MIALLIAGLAVGRFTRLVVDDRFPFAPVRRWFEDHSFEGHQLITCPWCLSGWAALLAVGGLEAVGPVPVPVLSWFAVWWLACASYWLTEVLARIATD